MDAPAPAHLPSRALWPRGRDPRAVAWSVTGLLLAANVLVRGFGVMPGWWATGFGAAVLVCLPVTLVLDVALRGRPRARRRAAVAHDGTTRFFVLRLVAIVVIGAAALIACVAALSGVATPWSGLGVLAALLLAARTECAARHRTS